MHTNRAIRLRLVAVLAVASLFNSGCDLLSTILSTIAERCAPDAIYVTTTDDLNTGGCTDSSCSLRNAITLANACPGFHSVFVPAGEYTLSIRGVRENNNRTGDLDLTGNVYVVAPHGATINGHYIDRVIDVQPGANVTLQGLTIREGAAPGPEDENGGGIRNAGTLTIANCFLTDNIGSTVSSIDTGLPGGRGGAVASSGDLAILSSTLQGNFAMLGGGVAVLAGHLTVYTISFVTNNAASSGGGLYLAPGAYANLTDSHFLGNAAQGGLGGAIYNDRGTVQLHQADITLNLAIPSGPPVGLSEGGAIWNSGTAFLDRAVVQQNQAYLGSAIYVSDWPGSALSLTNSAVLDNEEYSGAPPLYGAAIYAEGGLGLTDSTVSRNPDGVWATSSLQVSFSTIAGNAGYALRAGATRAPEIGNSIIASSGGITCDLDPRHAVASHDYNIDSTGECGLHGTHDVVADPMLLPLVVNSGTFVHPLAPGSPAIDTADGSVCPHDLSNDQRLSPRPEGGGCDRGAYELVPAHALTIATPATPIVEAAKPGIIVIPSSTPTSGPVTVQLALFQNSNCRRGPGTVYAVLTSVLKGQTVQLTGRNDDNTWWFTVLPGNNPCWLSEVAGTPSADTTQLPVLHAPPTPVPTQEPNTCTQYTNFNACVAAGCSWNPNKQACH